VVLVKVGLGLASSGAQGRIVGVGVEETHSVVGIVLLSILGDQRSVDGSRKVGRGIEVGNSRGRLASRSGKLGVTVTGGDDYVELFAPLALVGGRLGGDGVSEEGALYVGDGLRICAAGSRVVLGVALSEDVEAKAELLAVAEVGALLYVI